MEMIVVAGRQVGKRKAFLAIHRKLRRRKARRLASITTEWNERGVIERTNRERTQGEIVTMSASEPGRYQITWFDRDGYGGHHVEDTLEGVVKEMSHFYRPTKAFNIQTLSLSDRFQEGIERSFQIQRENAARMTANEE